jgi:tryptophan halogenase
MNTYDNILIIGGGTAGWMTALYLNKILPSSNITLVESDNIGIIGAGEGSVPTLVHFLNIVGISESEFLRKTSSTYKMGIDFINWRNDGKKYEHYFSGDGRYSYHFDARLLANYFKEVAVSRGINLIVDDVTEIITDSDKVVSVNLKNNNPIECDFLFDCSGFKRMILDNIFKGRWISFQQHLTVNSAIPFFLERTDTKMETVTNSTAMKHGWMWQIPIQGRWGCGYVYDDRYINREQAIEEVEEYLGINITNDRVIKFNAGCYMDCWKGNTISIGLSSGFLEPLEATSIFVIVKQLFLLDNTFLQNRKIEYNNLIYKAYEENMLFIYYHYLSKRNDTKFWQDYSTINVPEKLWEFMDADFNFKIKTDIEYRSTFSKYTGYNVLSWKTINAGINPINKLL